MTEEAPSWAVAAEPDAHARPEGPTPVRLRLLVVVVTALALAEAVHVSGRDDLVPGFRAALVGVVLLQIPLAVFAARRSAMAACGLFVYLATAAVAAATRGSADRVGILVAVALATYLLTSSLGAFPSPTLPRLEDPDRP